jgi:hypothetical protein
MAKSKRSNANALMRQLPTSMRFGAHEYALEKGTIPEHERSWGKINTDLHMITIDIDVPNGKRLAETVLHEILHGIWSDRYLPSNAPEEQIIEQLSAGIIAMFIDNPWMLTWLSRALRK